MKTETPWNLIYEALDLQQQEFQPTTFAVDNPELWALVIAPDVVMVLTQKQIDAIDDRDERHCLARLAHIPHECDEPQGIERHHILPQRYAQKVDFDPDLPENIATLCKNFHRHFIHPDVADALSHYREDKSNGIDSFHEIFNKRQEKLENREVYWNTEYDRILQAQAQKQNTQARKRGWKWPLSKLQKKWYGREEL